MVKYIKGKFITGLNMLRRGIERVKQMNRRKNILLGLVMLGIFGFSMIFVTGISMLRWGITTVREMSWRRKILLGLVVLGVFGFTMIEVTGQPGFCNSCHIMNPYYDSWKASSHHEVNCMECHFEPGFVGYVKGKGVAPAHMANYFLGRAATKPNATVKDTSCLRSQCHNYEDITSANINFNDVKFPHDKHVEKVVDGMKISCGMCHNRIEGNEHFKINRGVCFTCHFLKSGESENKLVQTGCRGCHKIPDVMESGLLSIDHMEFVSYGASCEKACHKREFEKSSEVPESVCLNCHNYGKSQHTDRTELHEIHTNCEKVECFACHGEVSHGQEESTSASTRMKCEKCHSETHNIQVSVYTASSHPQGKENRRIVSPMFLTHVECTGCHIEQSQPFSGNAYSFGKVTKAVPRACDTCHEPGTGQDYIPYWQGVIKKLHEQVSSKLVKLENIAKSEIDEKTARKLESECNKAKEILELVKSDGSWGIHNLKYTEALLIKADKIITEAQ
jgi:nitrate/TMAO reductase-like tetraheme cytochrome c subunit